MSADDDDRDIPDCFYLDLLPGPVQYRIVPGFPRYRVGLDRSVWIRRPERPAPWDDPRWRRVRTSSRDGRGEYVCLRHQGRECLRSVELLYRAAFSDPSRHAAWIRRIGPLAHVRSRPAVQAEPKPESTPVPSEPSPAPSPSPDPEPVATVLPNAADEERRDPYAEYRPVSGFPGYEVGSDYSCWTCRKPYDRPYEPGEPVIWRRVPLHPRPGKVPAVMLFRAGKPFLVTLALIVEKSFRVILPAGDPIQEGTRRGSDHGRALLDDSKVMEARRLKRSGWTYPMLAQHYGVCRNTMVQAVTGKTWSHLPMEEASPPCPAPLRMA